MSPFEQGPKTVEGEMQMKRSTPLKKRSSSAVVRLHFVLLLCLGLCCFNTHADAVSGASLIIVGTVSFDRNNTFGRRFKSTTDIDVTALGFFDATSLPAGSGTGLSQSHDVGICRVSDQVLIA